MTTYEKLYKKIRVGDIVKCTDTWDTENDFNRYGVVVIGTNRQKVVIWNDDSETLNFVLSCAIIHNQDKIFEFKTYTQKNQIYDEPFHGIVSHPNGSKGIFEGVYDDYFWKTYLKLEPNT